MRYWVTFFLVFFIAILAVVGLAGFRGEKMRHTPIEIFPDMDRQPKVRPEAPSLFFPDGKGSRLPVAGTVARGSHYLDNPLNTGLITGTTNFIENSPIPLTAQVMARGKERYQITCLPCHGPLADGNGITKKYGMAVVANLHDKRIVAMADGEIFRTISYGKNLMGGYAANVTVEDRWNIVAYLRALQLARLGGINDVPADLRAGLKP